MLPIALIIAMAVIVSAVSLAGRGLGGLAGSAISNSGNEARDAAEAGIDLIISRLNQPRNRQLMLAAVPMGQWGSSDPAIAAQLTNPCQPTDTRGEAITAADFGIGGSFVSLPGTGNRQYRLLRLTVRGPEGSGASYSSSGSSGTLSGGYTPRLINLASRSNTGQLELEVEGRSLGGTSSPRVQLRRTFELVPKQCGRSFGRSADDIGQPIPAAGLWSHGNDFRYSNTFPGLVLGLAGGGLSSSSNAVNLVRLNPSGSASTTSQPLSVLCRVASSADTCGNASGGINGVPVRLAPDLQAINNPNGTVPGWASPGTTCDKTAYRDGQLIGTLGCLRNGPNSYIYVSSSGRICRGGNTTACTIPLTNACKPTGSGSSIAYHCIVDALPTTLLTIDTSNAPIYLYYGPWSSSPTNSLEISHVYCPGSTSATCSNPATGGNITRAGVISAYPLANNFTLSPQPSGACVSSGGIRDMLLWLPTGNLSMSGTSCFRGVAYVNNLSLDGNASLAIADPLRIDDSLTWLGSTLTNSDPFNTDLRRIGMVLYEVVARRSIGTGLVKQ